MIRFLAIAALLASSALAQAPQGRQFVIRLEPVRAGLTLQNLTDEERQVATEHAKHLRDLLAQGKLKMAGQALDPKGLWGIVIVDAPDMETATAIMNSDPGVKEKLFRGEVTPFRVVFERTTESAKPAQ